MCRKLLFCPATENESLKRTQTWSVAERDFKGSMIFLTVLERSFKQIINPTFGSSAIFPSRAFAEITSVNLGRAKGNKTRENPLMIAKILVICQIMTASFLSLSIDKELTKVAL